MKKYRFKGIPPPRDYFEIALSKTMSMKKMVALAFNLSSCVFAFSQGTEGIPEIKMQFITHLYSSQQNYKALHHEKTGENDQYIFYQTSEALGNRYIAIAQSKKDTSQWVYYVEYPIATTEDIAAVAEVEKNVFEVLNLYVKTGRLKGSENTEGDIVRTNLLIAKNDTWFGEVVTDNATKKFHILLTNSRW
jgi:hypothetical protein